MATIKTDTSYNGLLCPGWIFAHYLYPMYSVSISASIRSIGITPMLGKKHCAATRVSLRYAVAGAL
ncbi:hypothetical protein ACOVJL_02885 [Scardovia wiggsiae]|uniref:hypothetical protein n=1 Tax=Scardovia wiggsiae TaxID=230143 RepID=UPI00374F4FF4